MSTGCDVSYGRAGRPPPIQPGLLSPRGGSPGSGRPGPPLAAGNEQPSSNGTANGSPDGAPVETGSDLTTRQGHPVYDNQNNRTVGDRGPIVLENYHFLEKISHFDRERIPERVVHARGAGAHGYFEAYGTVGGEPVGKFTRANGTMAYNNSPVGNPHVNYEPTSRGGPHQAAPLGTAHEPFVSGNVQRHAIARENNYQQAGERYRTFEPWERDELISNLVSLLSQCNKDIQDG